MHSVAPILHFFSAMRPDVEAGPSQLYRTAKVDPGFEPISGQKVRDEVRELHCLLLPNDGSRIQPFGSFYLSGCFFSLVRLDRTISTWRPSQTTQTHLSITSR
jgi:hypothetical protein